MGRFLISITVFVFLTETSDGQIPNIMDYYNTPDYMDYGGGGYNPFFPGMDPYEQDPKMVRRTFVEVAKSLVGYDDYSRASKYRIGKNKDKCHIFVYDVIKESGAEPPQRFPMFAMRSSPISAKQWKTRKSMAILLTGHFKPCQTPPRSGDIIADDNLVGVVTGIKRTTMADPTADPNGLITETDWGFRKGQRPVCWRYT